MSRLLLVLGVVFILLVGVAAGLWWYLFGPSSRQSAELVPATTVAFVSIPNAATIIAGYQTSHLKTLVDSSNAGAVQDTFANLAGQKNVDLVKTFLPNLSGQSFLAVTHFDADHPDQVGLIAAMKPKPGTEDFDTFLQKLKATYPDQLKQGKTGQSSVAGVDYQWIQGPGATDKICVAKLGGWIVTTWGEAPLQDWIERYQRKSSTPSLAENSDYQKSLARVGQDAMTSTYLNYHALVAMLTKQLAKDNPATGDYLSKKLGVIGGAMITSRFENGDIVDRFSVLMPKQAQIESGSDVDPCAFETLKFTGPGTLLYCAFGMNWKAYFKTLQDQQATAPLTGPAANPMAAGVLGLLQGWAQGAGLDLQKNILDALGPEFSLQLDWDTPSANPDMNIFVKVAKPDDFKPTITAIVNSIRQNYGAAGTITEHAVNGQHLATMQFAQAAFLSPTVTEDGPFLGIFTTQGAADRSYQRNANATLDHNPDFHRQLGDKLGGASEAFFLDSPHLLDRTYQTALPYLSLASMFSKDLAQMIKGRKMPDDLSWVAPIGTWAFALTPDDEGVVGYSASGVGNQGIFLVGALGGGATLAQSMGLLPKTGLSGIYPAANVAAAPPTAGLVQTLGQQNTTRQIKVAPFPDLPKIPGVDQKPPPDPYLVPRSIIYVTPEGKIFFEETLVASADFGDFLKAKKAANEDLKLIVNVDKAAPADVFSLVMDAGAHAGFGVLPYLHTTGSDSFPPPATAVPTASDAATNAAAPAAAPDASTNSALAPPPDATATPAAALPVDSGPTSNAIPVPSAPAKTP
jgi:biopolymer transport protein ExbD